MTLAVTLLIGTAAINAAVPLPNAPKPHVSKKVACLHVLEHVALGAGVYSAVSGPINWKWYPGVTATGAVAGFKEGSDAMSGRDSKKMAIIHSLEILAGAGIVAAIKH